MSYSSWISEAFNKIFITHALFVLRTCWRETTQCYCTYSTEPLVSNRWSQRQGNLNRILPKEIRKQTRLISEKCKRSDNLFFSMDASELVSKKCRTLTQLLPKEIKSRRLNMELDLQSLFGLHVQLCIAVLIGWVPATPSFPPTFGFIYEGAIGQPR